MFIKTQSGEILCKEICSYEDIDDELVGHPDAIYDDASQQHRVQWLITELKTNNAEKPIMEIGTACGYILNKIDGDIGIDKKTDRLLVAKRKYPNKKFFYADILNLEPFYDLGINTIIAAEILEHVPYYVAHHALVHCLKTAPVIYYTVPNSVKDPNVVKNKEHLWYPNFQNMKTLLDYTAEHIPMIYDIREVNNFFYGIIKRINKNE